MKLGLIGLYSMKASSSAMIRYTKDIPMTVCQPCATPDTAYDYCVICIYGGITAVVYSPTMPYLTAPDTLMACFQRGRLLLAAVRNGSIKGRRRSM